MVRLLVLDLATLVVGLGEIASKSLAMSAEAIGLACDDERARELLGLAPIDAFAKLQAHQPQDRLLRGVRIFERALAAQLARRDLVREVEDTSATLRSLRSQGIRLAIATPFSHDLADLCLRSTTWIGEGLVDTVVTADDVSYGRPRSDLVVECMRRTGVMDLDDVGKVGSTLVDLAEGAIAGCAMNIGATWGCHSKDELFLRPHTHLIDRMPVLLDLVALAPFTCAPRHSSAKLRA